MKKIFILLILFCAWIDILAQNFDPPLRLEFDMAENKSMNMELLGRNGLVLFFQKNTKDDTKWTVCHYDTNFQLLKMRSVPFETKTNVCVIASDEHFFYAMLQSDAARTNIANTYILRYDAQTKKIDVFSFYQAEKGRIMSMSHYGNIFVYSILNSKSEEQIYVFNTKSLEHSVLHQDKSNSCEFQDAYIDTLFRSLWVVSKWHESKKQTAVHLTQLDTNGAVLQEFPLETDNKYTLNSCKIIYANDNAMFLSGNYLNHEEQKQSTKNNNSGVFTIYLKDNYIEQILFFEYALMENWYAIHKNLSGSYDMSYFVMQNDSLIILATDFYMPEYQQYYNNQYAGSGFYSVPIVESKLIGYRYQTACLFTFDRSGKLLYYNPFNYSGLLLKSVRPLFNGYIDEETNEMLFLFGYNNKMFSLVYDKTEIVQGIKTLTIASSSRFESISTAEKSICQHWYGNNFIYSAYQRTSKKYGSSSRKNTKYVFGINKLEYR